MRKLALPALLAVAGCSTMPVAVPQHLCSTAATGGFIGQPANQQTGNAIMRASNSSALRWAPPGVMLTMEFSPARVTVRTGPDGRITAINCG